MFVNEMLVSLASHAFCKLLSLYMGIFKHTATAVLQMLFLQSVLYLLCIPETHSLCYFLGGSDGSPLILAAYHNKKRFV